MSDLIAWLRAQLDDDERVAREAASGPAGATWTAGVNGLAMPYITGAKADGGWLRSVAEPEEIEYAEHIARHDPARVLAEVDAKRKILDLHSTPHTVVDGFCVEDDGPCTHAGESQCSICGQDPCDTVRLIAQPCAGRPGWREEWRA